MQFSCPERPRCSWTQNVHRITCSDRDGSHWDVFSTAVDWKYSGDSNRHRAKKHWENPDKGFWVCIKDTE